MEAVDWTGLSALAAIALGAIGYLAHQMNARFDRVDARLDRLEERYVRHLELHAGHTP